MSGFIARNDPSLVLVPDWADFLAWAKEGGYGEEYFDVNDSRCGALQREYLAERDGAIQ
jgi:hypothetical protein